jgi:hypothetical protein
MKRNERENKENAVRLLFPEIRKIYATKNLKIYWIIPKLCRHVHVQLSPLYGLGAAHDSVV